MTNHQIDVRTPWHQTTQGCWSLTLAGGGITVRVTQRKAGQPFQRILLDEVGKQRWSSLGTTEADEAEQLAREFLRALLGMQSPTSAAAGSVGTPSVARDAASGSATNDASSVPEDTPLTLGRLITLYLASAAYQNLDTSTKICYLSCARVLQASIGADFDVAKLDAEVIEAHRGRRAKGGITYERTRQTKAGPRTTLVTTKPVRTRACGSDLQLLRIMLYWATRTRDQKTGRWLLQQFPVRGGITVSQEQNKVRSFATFERFERVMNGIQRARREATLRRDDTALRRLRYLELALVLVEATGRRIETVSQLRRDDFTLNPGRDFEEASFRIRPEIEKTNSAQEYPLPQSVARRVHALLEERGVPANGMCFPKRYDEARSVSADELTVWLRDFEAEIGLPKLPRGVWHPYRRKWAKERKDLPAKDVMAAGGWKDVKTFMDSYNEPDMETMRRVAEEPERRREAKRAAAEQPATRAAVGQRSPLVRQRPARAALPPGGTNEPRVLPLRRDG